MGQRLSSQELVALLRSRYGNDNQAKRFRLELKTWRRHTGEPLQTVFQDIKHLMALAFPGQTGSMAEITAIDAFVDSFRDKNLSKQFLQKGPATLPAALTWAMRIEAMDDSGPTDTPIKYERGGHRRECGFAHAVVPEVVFTYPFPTVSARQPVTSLHECQMELEEWRNYAVQQERESSSRRLPPAATTAVVGFCGR